MAKTISDTEFQEFRQAVVDEALKAARTNGWCSVVQDTLRKVGLGDLLPPAFVVQRQYRKGAKWIDQDTETTERKGRSAIRDWVIDKTPRQGADNEYLEATYVNQYNVDRVLRQVKEAQARFKAAGKPKIPEYPKYRLVKRTNVDEVLFTEGDK